MSKLLQFAFLTVGLGLFSFGCQKKAVSSTVESGIKVAPTSQQSRLDDCQQSLQIRKEVKALLNPTGQNNANEARFYQLARAQNKSDSRSLKSLVDRLRLKMEGLGCLRVQRGCFAELITANIQKGLTTLDRVKYGHTLKFKAIDGEPKIFVRATGQRPLIDPRQPGGEVIDRYANRYHWVFRKAAGDLHPGFIWAALSGKEPYHLNGGYAQVCYDSPKSCRDKKYVKVLRFFGELYKRGYVTRVDRGADLDFLGLGDIANLYPVDIQKTKSLEQDAAIKTLAEKELGPEAFGVTLRLFRERLNPVLLPQAQGKYEITGSVMQKLNMEIPGVSADGWSVYYMDHHRITAAHDLRMSIEVYFSRTFLSLN